MSVKGVWITWEKQRRNQGISSALGWELYDIVYNDCRVIRYLKSFVKTLSILKAEKPAFVAAQNPSIVLALMVVLLKFVFGYTCIIDAHNAGLFPFEGRSKVLNFAARLIQRLSDWTIVTNSVLAEIVNKNGKAIVLPDKIPYPPSVTRAANLKGMVNLAFICSFSLDEPYHEVIEAARSIPDDIFIYITGKFKDKLSEEEMPPNVKLLGFIPDNQYWDLISTVDGIMVLTTRDDCLVCGAYEAVALKKPMILSSTQAIKSYFHSGCIYTRPDSDEIQKAILQFIEAKARLSEEVVALEKKLRTEWEDSFSTLVKKIGIQ